MSKSKQLPYSPPALAQSGFTIIEMMIVLAIAGLVLLVVFLAVPALQRNARNTARSNDVSKTLTALHEFVNNNNSLAPDTTTVINGTIVISSTISGTNDVSVKPGYYRGTGGVSISGSGAGSAGVNNTTKNTVVIYAGAECNAEGTQAVDGSNRAFAATYTLEIDAKQCKSL